MREHPACPHCGQRMMHVRMGARLPPQKVRIFDAIRRAGPSGITRDDIVESLGLDITDNCLRAHIWQINQILIRSDAIVRIACRRDRMFGSVHFLIGERTLGERKIALAKEKRI